MSKKITLEGLDHFKDNENAMIASKPESTNTATYAHAVGEYFYWKGVLQEVTAAIAVGGTIQTNTNVKPAVLADNVSFLKESTNELKTALNFVFYDYEDPKICFEAGQNRYVSSGTLKKTNDSERGSSLPFTPCTRYLRVVQTGTVTIGIHGCVGGVWTSSVYKNLSNDAVIDTSDYDLLCIQLIGSTAITSSDFPKVYEQKTEFIDYRVNDYAKTLTASDFVSGTCSGRLITSNSNRLATKKLIPVKIGDVITYNNPTLKIVFGIYEWNSTSLNFNGGWENANPNMRQIICPNEGYLMCMVEGSSITTSDYDCNITIYNSLTALTSIAPKLLNYNVSTIAFLGDSLTAGSGTSKAYHMYLADRFGWTCKNYGYGGSGYIQSNSSTTGRMGTGETGIAPLITNETKIIPNDFLTRIATIPTTVDALVIFGGLNDWMHGDSISVADFTNGVNNVLDYAQTNFITKPIIVMLPSPVANDDTPNETTGKTLADYCNIIKECCEAHGILCIDVFGESGLNPDNTANDTAFYVRDDTNVSDGIHMNHNAHKAVSNLVAFPIMNKLY